MGYCFLWEHTNSENGKSLVITNADPVVFQVKVELFVHGVRGVWFIFDGLGSTFIDWFDRDRLLASPYHDIKTGDFQFYSITG